MAMQFVYRADGAIVEVGEKVYFVSTIGQRIEGQVINLEASPAGDGYIAEVAFLDQSWSEMARDGLTCDVNDLITQKDINMASSSSSSSTTMESNPQSSSASSSPLRTEDDIRAVFTDLKKKPRGGGTYGHSASRRGIGGGALVPRLHNHKCSMHIESSSYAFRSGILSVIRDGLLDPMKASVTWGQVMMVVSTLFGHDATGGGADALLSGIETSPSFDFNQPSATKGSAYSFSGSAVVQKLCADSTSCYLLIRYCAPIEEFICSDRMAELFISTEEITGMVQQAGVLGGLVWGRFIEEQSMIELFQVFAQHAFGVCPQIQLDTIVTAVTRTGQRVRCLASTGYHADTDGSMICILRLMPLGAWDSKDPNSPTTQRLLLHDDDDGCYYSKGNGREKSTCTTSADPRADEWSAILEEEGPSPSTDFTSATGAWEEEEEEIIVVGGGKGKGLHNDDLSSLHSSSTRRSHRSKCSNGNRSDHTTASSSTTTCSSSFVAPVKRSMQLQASSNPTTNSATYHPAILSSASSVPSQFPPPVPSSSSPGHFTNNKKKQQQGQERKQPAATIEERDMMDLSFLESYADGEDGVPVDEFDSFFESMGSLQMA